MSESKYIEQARALAAQCWCDQETSHLVVDVGLAEAFAQRLATWMESVAELARTAEFYHRIVTKVGEMFGDAAKTSDDGSVQQDVLALRVPELVQQTLKRIETLEEVVAKHLHQRKCHDCGHVFYCPDNVSPHCLCPQCRSQDTRLHRIA